MLDLTSALQCKRDTDGFLSGLGACRYEAVFAEKQALDRAYSAVAEMLNCESSEVAILQSATAAWTQASVFMQF